MQSKANTDPVWFFILLIFADAVFIGLHLLHYHSDALPDARFAITQDWGYAEVFQYIKELWIVILLSAAAVRRSKPVLFSWALVFLYLLLDDSLQIHETGGALLADYLGFPALLGMRPEDLGELAVSASIGGLFLLILGSTYVLSDPSSRRIFRHLFLLMAALAFFGVAVDAAHSVVAGTGGGGEFDLLEDGGEMAVVSVIAWYAFRLNSESQH